MHQTAPELWTAVYSLLSQDTGSVSRQPSTITETIEDDDDAYEAEFWKDFEEDDSDMMDKAHDTEDIPSQRPWQQWTRAERREAIKRVVSKFVCSTRHLGLIGIQKATVIISIMLQSVNLRPTPAHSRGRRGRSL